MILHALSIVYPAVTRIVTGYKTLEIRSWQPDRLPLLDLLLVENHRRLDQDGDVDPRALAMALVDIHVVRSWTEDDARKDGQVFAPHYFAWVLANIRPLASPLPVEARRLIYQVEVPAGLRSKFLPALLFA